ncbi:hypothetical protein [Kineococcus rhizosphaerae]|uniref:hypothetical protein n=1 Tax=Kineococcus rhizosphaerae TaxID=559628 RepID=UPI000D07CF3B|nr:hypothetical protein [Kineococcus rhizosphaerae]
MSNAQDQRLPSGPSRSAVDPQATSEQDRALDAVLARLDGLDAVGVHDHVEVYSAVDRALRERLAGAED